jgi:hypothetical protein
MSYTPFISTFLPLRSGYALIPVVIASITSYLLFIVDNDHVLVASFAFKNAGFVHKLNEIDSVDPDGQLPLHFV